MTITLMNLLLCDDPSTDDLLEKIDDHHVDEFASM